MKIKTQIAIALLGALSTVVPLQSVRRAYLRAFHQDWDARTGNQADDNFDSDVYNGHPFEWSRRPVPTLVADRLLAEHDASVEQHLHPEWNFQDLLEQNLHS